MPGGAYWLRAAGAELVYRDEQDGWAVWQRQDVVAVTGDLSLDQEGRERFERAYFAACRIADSEARR